MPIFVYSAIPTEAFVLICRKDVTEQGKIRKSLQFARWDLTNDTVVYDTHLYTNLTTLRLFGCSLRKDGQEMIVSIANYSLPSDLYHFEHFTLVIDTQTFAIQHLISLQDSYVVPPYYRYGIQYDHAIYYRYNDQPYTDECYLRLLTSDKIVNNYRFQAHQLYKQPFNDSLNHRVLVCFKKHPFSVFALKQLEVKGLEVKGNFKTLVHTFEQPGTLGTLNRVDLYTIYIQ